MEQDDRATVVGGDLFNWLNARSIDRSPPADLIFFDPPYRFLATENLVEPCNELSKLIGTQGSAVVQLGKVRQQKHAFAFHPSKGYA